MNKWTIASVDSGKRLLAFAKQKLGDDFTTKDLRWSIEHHRCRFNRKVERFCSRRLSVGDRIEIYPLKKLFFQFEADRVLFEDELLLAYNKPAGIASPDLAKLLELYLVHRLDRDTTGVMLFAKDREGQKELENLFRLRKIEKSYLAWVVGTPKEKSGVIDAPVAKIGQKEGEVTWGVADNEKGLEAKTEWVLEKPGKEASLIRCFPHTGRTHQIRVHLSHIGLPVVGDVRYGSREACKTFRPLLHAEKVRVNGQEILAPLPKDFSLKRS